MPLQDYRRKRDFQRTPEPSGNGDAASPGGGRYVIHKHAASHLHYDLRLETGGVLRCWAVPKGPSLDPSERRLAVQTEDHPLEYLDFEGVIPAGEYGGGAMIMWDRGAWEPEGDFDATYRAGQLKLRLNGEKLQGRWALVKMKPRPGEADRNWLLIKERSENVRPLSKGDILQELPHSVVSGRTVEELAGIAALEQGRHWNSRKNSPTPGEVPFDPAGIPKSVRAAMPQEISPQLATQSMKLPDGPHWLHEIKFDGYRLLCFIEDGRVRLLTRRNNDWTERFPHLVEAAGRLNVPSAILDGEVVGLLPNGASSFTMLQSALKQGRPRQLIYFVFDLLYVDGYDLRRSALSDRKQALAALLGQTAPGPLQYVDHIAGPGAAFFGECRRLGLEGVVSKRSDRPHRAGRSHEWLKTKCVLRDEFVVGGFTDPDGSRIGLGALLVGHFDEDGRLLYAGRVGSGFDESQLADLGRRLKSIELRKTPFADMTRDWVKRGTHWVRPQLVVQVQYAGWSNDGMLRHPVFQGEREDVAAASIVRARVTDGDSSSDDAPAVEAPLPASGKRLSPRQLASLSDVQLTHPERVMYEAPRVTKLDLARYYAAVAEWILPHIVRRPLSLVRSPEGEGRESFFQKRPMPGLPEAIRRFTTKEDGEPVEHLMIEDLAGLLSLVQFGVLEIHPWGSRVDRIERPDRLVFDLDPGPEVTWTRTIGVALRLQELLDSAGLVSFVKTTGGKGLHVVLPIERKHDWEQAKRFSQAVAKRLASESPRELTLSPSKQARQGKVYIDYHRNARGATAVAAYSTRNRPGATVSVPLTWEELSHQAGPAEYSVTNVVRRLAALKADPWADLTEVRQSLTAGVRRAFGMA